LRFGTTLTVTASGRPGRVLRATTSQGTGFGIVYPTSGSLNLPLRDLSVWIKDSNWFYFYVRVHATNGSDYYIQYKPSNGSPYPSGSYAIVPVGSQYADGTWHELRRDLDADLRSVFGVGVEQVLGIYIRGDYDLDELTLIGREELSYYYAAGARVAMRVDDGGGDVVYYLHADHLGSTSLATTYSGQQVTGHPLLPLRRATLERQRRHFTNRLHVHRATRRELRPDGLPRAILRPLSCSRFSAQRCHRRPRLRAGARVP